MLRHLPMQIIDFKQLVLLIDIFHSFADVLTCSQETQVCLQYKYGAIIVVIAVNIHPLLFQLIKLIAKY